MTTVNFPEDQTPHALMQARMAELTRMRRGTLVTKALRLRGTKGLATSGKHGGPMFASMTKREIAIYIIALEGL